MISVCYLDIVQLLIFGTNINRLQYLLLWDEHIIANLYCCVPLDALITVNGTTLTLKLCVLFAVYVLMPFEDIIKGSRDK